MAVNRASPCLERPVKTIETWYPVCLLPVQEMTTPLQCTFPLSRGDDTGLSRAARLAHGGDVIDVYVESRGHKSVNGKW